MRSWRQLAAAFAVALTLIENARGQAQAPPPELAEILALRVSVGSIAMLVRVAGHPQAQQRLSEAITNTDPDIRTVAARVVTVTASRGLPDVRAQLARESDALVTTEPLRSQSLAPPLTMQRLLMRQRAAGLVQSKYWPNRWHECDPSRWKHWHRIWQCRRPTR